MLGGDNSRSKLVLTEGKEDENEEWDGDGKNDGKQPYLIMSRG